MMAGKADRFEVENDKRKAKMVTAQIQAINESEPQNSHLSPVKLSFIAGSHIAQSEF
jgi:hypothetical protein